MAVLASGRRYEGCGRLLDMRTAYRVDTVRAAEAALKARLPEGALMQRAAAGLAAACRGLLPRVYGARVVLLDRKSTRQNSSHLSESRMPSSA